MTDGGLQSHMLSVSWFIHSGDEGAASTFAATHPGVEWVGNAAMASRLGSSLDVEDAGIDIFNEIRGVLSKANKLDSKAWNRLAMASSAWIRSELEPGWRVRLSQLGVDAESVVDAVAWHVQGMFFETEYAPWLKRKINLDRYLPVYEAGFLPCGWTGDWRSSTLLFY